MERTDGDQTTATGGPSFTSSELDGIQALVAASRIIRSMNLAESTARSSELVDLTEDFINGEEKERNEVSKERESTDSKEEETAKAEQSRKREREEYGPDESTEDLTPVIRVLKKFGLFMVAMQWDKACFDLDQWNVLQRGLQL